MMRPFAGLESPARNISSSSNGTENNERSRARKREKGSKKAKRIKGQYIDRIAMSLPRDLTRCDSL